MNRSFITDPYLLTLQPAEKMHIVWIQRQPVPGLVEFGRTAQLGQLLNATCLPLMGLLAPASPAGYAEDPAENKPLLLWQCIATIEGLQPGETVYYRCRSGEELTDTFFFHTAPEPGRPFRFAQISDLQGFNPCEHSVYQIGCQRPDFLLFSGDATFHSRRATQWFDLPEYGQTPEERQRAFFPCMQQRGHARLMQYCPTFLCPGNHEVDDIRVGTDKDFSRDENNWSWTVYMQLFRPLYPEMDTGLSGRRWYSADYGDLHIISLHIQRWALWGACEAPGWRLADPIAPGSCQYQWLEQDLHASTAPFKWVIQHWHLLNKGTDTQPNLCQPETDESGCVRYPFDHGGALMDLYEKYGVNAVSYGHSHVYERYFAKNCHYIEAAYLGCCCREGNAPLHPSGLVPLVEDNSCQSFLILERNDTGLEARGYYAQDPPVLFDRYQIADARGKAVAPAQGGKEV